MSANRGVGHFAQRRARLPLSLRPWLLALAAAQYLASAAPAAPPPPRCPSGRIPGGARVPERGARAVLSRTTGSAVGCARRFCGGHGQRDFGVLRRRRRCESREPGAANGFHGAQHRLHFKNPERGRRNAVIRTRQGAPRCGNTRLRTLVPAKVPSDHRTATSDAYLRYQALPGRGSSARRRSTRSGTTTASKSPHDTGAMTRCCLRPVRSLPTPATQ